MHGEVYELYDTFCKTCQMCMHDHWCMIHDCNPCMALKKCKKNEFSDYVKNVE